MTTKINIYHDVSVESLSNNGLLDVRMESVSPITSRQCLRMTMIWTLKKKKTNKPQNGKPYVYMVPNIAEDYQLEKMMIEVDTNWNKAFISETQRKGAESNH